MRFVLEEALFSKMRRGSRERYEIPDSALPYLAMQFAAVARHPTARAELFRVLQLEIALRDSLGSPTAARRLRMLRSTTPHVVASVRARLLRLKPPSTIERGRRFTESQGRALALRAPLVAQKKFKGVNEDGKGWNRQRR